MMVLNSDQIRFVKGRADWIVGELKIKIGLRYSDEQLANWLAAQLTEICSMGHASAYHDIQSSPWEWIWGTLNIEEMNQKSAEGWEFVGIIGARMDSFLWRRRKAVSDGQG